jgi:cyclohexa-1,5-dienecarbonyl-CoA hydratase
MIDLDLHRLEIDEGIAHIVLDRPDHNVLTIEMMREMTALLAGLNADTSIKCVVLAAQGSSWSAGIEPSDRKPERAPEMVRAYCALLEQMHALEMPSIAAVHGPCLGGGMEMAIACDMIVASTAAVFGLPAVERGLFSPYAAVRLPHLVGPSRAVEICTTGKRYMAEEVHRMGLTSALLAVDDFEAGLAELVRKIQQGQPQALRLNKRAVTRHLGMDIHQAIRGAGDLLLDQMHLFNKKI